MKTLNFILLLTCCFPQVECQRQNNYNNILFKIPSDDFRSYLSLYDIINLPINSDSIINFKKKSIAKQEYQAYIKKYLCSENDCFASNARYWTCGLINQDKGDFIITLSRFENELSYSYYKLNTYDYFGAKIDELIFHEGTELYNTLPDEIETIQKRGEINENFKIIVKEFKTYTSFKDSSGIYNFYGVFQIYNYYLTQDGHFKITYKSLSEKRRYSISNQAPQGHFPKFLPID